jgi:DNA-binding NarL/FixJ family response regulator
MTRLLIIADHALAAHVIRRALSPAAGFQAVAALDGRTSVRGRVARRCPDVVVVDDAGVRRRALARVREAADALPDATVVLLVPAPDSGGLDEAFDAGADVVVAKVMAPAALATVLRETVRGTVVHRPRPPAAEGTAADCGLTRREAEILALAAQGATNRRIAGELWITEQTVKFHLSNTYRKLGVANRTEATRFAYASGLVALGEGPGPAPSRAVAATAA